MRIHQRQAEAGRTAYDVSCAGCHGADLTGSSDAPALTGPNFSGAWGSRPVNELFRHIMETMPPQAPGSLGEEMTLNVVAYLIQRMGGAPGSQDLTIKTATTVNAAAASRGSGPPSMALGAGTGSGQGRGGADVCARRHRQRRSEELRPRDAGDAEESACRATGSSSAGTITDGATARSIRSPATTCRI